MATTTSTNTEAKPEIIVKADAAVVKSIAAYFQADAKAQAAVAAAEGGYIGIARASIPVVARQGYTERKQVSQLLFMSFCQQAGVLELDDADEKKVAVIKRNESNVSNLVAIIMPKDADLTKARDTAFDYNDKLPKDCRPNLRIGQKHLLDIVRGKTLVDDVIAVKEGREPSKPTSATGQQSAAKAGVNATATQPDANQQAQASGDATNVPAPNQPADATNGPALPGEAVKTPADAFRHVLKTMLPNYQLNLGMSKDDIKRVLLEELEKFMAA